MADRTLFVKRAANGETRGLDPRSLPKDVLRVLGHRESPLSAIRDYCIDCSGGNRGEADKCVAIGCPLWPFRFGRNPFHAKARAHLATLRSEADE